LFNFVGNIGIKMRKDIRKPVPYLLASILINMIQLPQDVIKYLQTRISECNHNVSYNLSTFPFTHEEALDHKLIGEFIGQGPRKFGSGWTVRFDAHYIGGGRHYRTFEVADLGLMVIFRKKGKIIRSKLAFIQSKKLYVNTLKFKEFDPYYRQGMGRLLVSEEEHLELVKYQILKYTEESKYKALKIGSEQEDVMRHFSKRFDVKLYYLFYNPCNIPWGIKSPVEELPNIEQNLIGCRVIPKPELDKALKIFDKDHSPSFGDIKYQLDSMNFEKEHDAGWRLEYFINDLLIGCKEGLIDDSPNFETLRELLSQKTSPISSALSITFDEE